MLTSACCDARTQFVSGQETVTEYNYQAIGHTVCHGCGEKCRLKIDVEFYAEVSE